MTGPLTLAQRLRDQHHMTQGDGLGAMLATANEAANRIEELENDLRIGMANFDALKHDIARHVQIASDEAALADSLVASKARISAELAEARKREELARTVIGDLLADHTPVGLRGIQALNKAVAFLASKEASHAAE